ncbi:MAG: SHOCT domain-containing protein [Sulfurimonadaceae bacterium]
MKKLMTLIVGVGMLLYLSGCSRVPFEAQTLPNDKALVYVYAIDNVGDGEDSSNPRYKILINEQRVSERVEQGEYLGFELQPAETKVSVIRGSLIEHSMTINTAAGQQYFFKIVTDHAGGDFKFSQVSQQQGIKEIEKTYLAGASSDEGMFDGTILGNEDEEKEKTNTSEQSDADELERLHDLKEKGAITQEEYETLKAKVINKQ